MKINNLPNKYLAIWKKALPILKKGRPGDDTHAREIVNFILNYNGRLKIDKDVLIPVAMMHDIGHGAIMPEHFKFVTGPEKIKNGKLAHMLAGAKIANDILISAKYDKKLITEIVDIISMHDFDQLDGIDIKKIYDTKNKKLFHDFDSLDRYTETRLENIKTIYPDKKAIVIQLQGLVDMIFYDEIKKIAKRQLLVLTDKYIK